MKDMEWEYLGDGVYAASDGFGVWLHTGSHDNPDQRVYIEVPMVWAALVEFVKRSLT